MQRCRDRAQGTTSFLIGTRWWVHDPDSQQKWSRNEKSFRELGRSAVGKRAWQKQCAREPNENSEYDIEPIGVSRADVEMGNEEDEESLEAEIPRVRMNPKNPTSRERNKNMKIQDMLFTGVGVRLVSKVEVLVDSIELNC